MVLQLLGDFSRLPDGIDPGPDRNFRPRSPLTRQLLEISQICLTDSIGGTGTNLVTGSGAVPEIFSL